MGLHSKASLGARHPLPDLIYADETARLAATGFTVDDVWKAYGQESDNSLWLLVDHSPITWVELSSVVGVGDVVGPASSTDNAITRFSGTTGKTIQNSTVLISDAGSIDMGTGSIINVGNVDGRDVSTDGAALDAHLVDTTNPHETGIDNLESGTLAQLNAIITDATLDDSSDPRPPLIASAAYGDIIVRNATDWVRLAPGTTGQYLATAGVGELPSWVTPSGAGDVIGPASATNNAVVRFDSTTGKLIQNSGVIIGDDGDVSGIRSIQMDLLDPSVVPHSEGLIFYDGTSHSLVVYNSETDIAQQLGQEFYIRVLNNSGVTIQNGSSVYLSGASGGLLTIELSLANAVSTAYAVGIATHDIENATEGFVTTMGGVTMDTSMFTSGDVLYVSDITPGALTATVPDGGSIPVRVGVVKTVGSTGRLWVSTHGLPFDDDKSLYLPGDIQISTNGATLVAPRIIGGTDMTAGEGMRYQFGDANNGWQNGYDQAMQLWAYHSIIFMGNRSTSGAPSMVTTSNVGVLVQNTVAAAPAMEIRRATGQTANLLEFRDSVLTLLTAVDADGDLNLINHDVYAARTITFNSVPIVTPVAGTVTCAFDNYQKIIVNLNNNATVTVQLNTPVGPGNFMLEIRQGGSAPTTTLNWSTEGTHALYAPGGSITIQAGTGSITLVGFFYNGSAWYATSSPMALVLAN